MTNISKLFPINTQPGIKRDGTAYTGNFYIDGQWCRFMRGLPRKMGGYRQILGGLPNITRGTYIIPNVPVFNVYLGDSNSLQYFSIDQYGNPVSPLVDRTPVGFLSNNDNNWQFDLMYQTVSNTNSIIAHAAPNLSYIDNIVEYPVYYGDVTQNTPLIPTGFSVSGGCVVLNPYLVMFGNYGEILISNANDPTTLLNQARISSQKIVHGLAVRAGNSSPGGLLWTLNSLIRMTKVSITGEVVFSFDTVTDQSSILSSSGVIEYDGQFFWAGIDRFLVYNGTVSELPNDKNLLWFFQNLNYAYRQKVWATKIQEFGEIWWHFPFGNSTECNAAVIYNVRERTWYDTQFEEDITVGRSSGYFEQVFADPIWTDTQGNVWIHETGVDKNVNGVLEAIPSSFETGDISWAAIGPTGSWTGTDRLIDLQRIEPDFWQLGGTLNLSVKGRAYYNSPIQISAPYPITVNTLKIDMREQRRFMTLEFNSNEVGGFYELGQLLMDIRVGDTRP